MRLFVTSKGSSAATLENIQALARAEGAVWIEQEVPTDEAGLWRQTRELVKAFFGGNGMRMNWNTADLSRGWPSYLS